MERKKNIQHMYIQIARDCYDQKNVIQNYLMVIQVLELLI